MLLCENGAIASHKTIFHGEIRRNKKMNEQGRRRCKTTEEKYKSKQYHINIINNNKNIITWNMVIVKTLFFKV